MRGKVSTISCNGKNGTGTRNRGWQIVELCINKKQAIEKTKNESKTEQNVRTEKEEEAMAKAKAKKTLMPHYEILLALSSLWIKMNYCTATTTAATTTTMATTVRTTITTTRVNNGNGNHNTSKR